jgi:hypothetical protein
VVETTDDTFFQAGGINCFSVDNNDVFWFGCAEGLMRWDGNDFTLFTMDNSPLPANNVRGIDIRPDGLIGISAADNNPQSGIALLDGDPENEENWTVFHYGESPQPHWQIETAQFDTNGDLWVSALSMGTAVLRTGNADLEIIATTPEDQATDVNPADTIVVTFNQEITAYDLSGITITPDPGNVSSSTEGNKLLIAHNNLDWNTGYTVHIPAFSVTNGWLPLENDFQWSFSTSLPTGIHDERAVSRHSIYPNPAQQSIHFINAQDETGSYIITDMQGKVMLRSPFYGTKISIDISDLATGIYLFSTLTGQMHTTQKLIIQ